MKTLRPIIPLFTAVTITLFASILPARAASTVTALEMGGDVVFMGAGNLNLGAWTFVTAINTASGVEPDTQFLVGATAIIDIYGSPSNFTGLTSIGPGSFQFGDSGSGDLFGIEFDNSGRLVVFVTRKER